MAQTTVPGKIPGEFAVSHSGAATYRIPIEVPPGVAGMHPQLALSYSSQAGNGIMGMGWNIDGLSAITRCPKTLATDGVRGAVNFNTEDRFCLDGQRLINVAGSYGAAGSEYRTELESFSRITAHGAAAGNPANGPERFIVQTKAGLTLEYGATADSRIEAQGKAVVRVWALNRTMDVKGTRLADVLSNAITTEALNRDAQRVVAVTAPDITRTPRFLAVLAGVEMALGPVAAAQVKALVNQWVVAFNTQLKARFAGHSRVVVVDFYAEFNKWLDTPAMYGLTNTTRPACPVTGVDGQGLPTYDIASCTAGFLSANPPMGETGPNWWTSYVFSDNFHGTPRTNELMGNLVVQALEAKGWK